MNTAPFSPGVLPGRAVVRVAGPDARHFLHTLLTCEIEGLKPGEAGYGALLSPQGKMLFDIFVLHGKAEAWLIDCAASQRAGLIKRLTFYKLRAKLDIAPADLEVGVASKAPDRDLSYPDPRTPRMGWRFFAEPGSLPEAQGYDAARIGLGLADSDADLGTGEFFPHEANLDQLGGISFSKGCYIGQEVVSRIEHRGTARSRILPIRLSAAAPPKGSDIRVGEKAVGTLLSSSGMAALVLLRLDRLAQQRETLLTEGATVELLKPHWVRYDVPGIEVGA